MYGSTDLNGELHPPIVTELPENIVKALDNVARAASQSPTDTKVVKEWFAIIDYIGKELSRPIAYQHLRAFRAHAQFALRCSESVNIVDEIYNHLRQSYFYEAQDNFDSYCIALEWKREAKNKFYMPRRNVLGTLVQDFQDLEDRVIKFLDINMPPRVGKSTLLLFYLTWAMGKRPMEANAIGGHTGSLVQTFYDELLAIIADPHTYCFSEIFPLSPLVYTSAKYLKIDLQKRRRFPTVTCRSLESGWTGEIEASEDGLLIMDDLVKDLEEALNITRLDMKYNTYLNITKDRMKDGARQIMIATRWNVFDPSGRIREQYIDDPLYRFRAVPALNSRNESNFQYDHGVGFSTAYYLDMKASLNDADWMAKYQQTPYVREGLLFPPDSLKYYNGITPGDVSDPPRPPDAVVAVVDVAWGGGDSLSMPIAHVYDGEAYIVDWLFSTGTKEITRPLVVGMVKKHGIQMLRFEANNGGDEYADTVDALLKAEGVKIRVYYKKAPGNMAKVSRIVQWSDDIKNFYFLEDSKRSEMYRKAMREVNLFVQIGKNKHDDAPDSLAQLADELQHGKPTELKVFGRPF